MWSQENTTPGIANILEIEVTCSVPEEHRRRVEARAADIPGMKMPTWADVVAREYHAWDREHLGDRSYVLGSRGAPAESRSASGGYSRHEDANMGRCGRKRIPRLGSRTSG